MNFLYDTPVSPILGYCQRISGIVAQLVEQGPFKAKVAGSSPANPTMLIHKIPCENKGFFNKYSITHPTLQDPSFSPRILAYQSHPEHIVP